MTGMNGISSGFIGQLAAESWFPAVAVSLALGLVFCVTAITLLFVKRKWLQVVMVLLVCVLADAGLLWGLQAFRNQSEDMASLSKLMSDYMSLIEKTTGSGLNSGSGLNPDMGLNVNPEMLQECMKMISELDLGGGSDLSTGMSAFLTNLTGAMPGSIPAEAPPPPELSTNVSTNTSM